MVFANPAAVPHIWRTRKLEARLVAQGASPLANMELDLKTNKDLVDTFVDFIIHRSAKQTSSVELSWQNKLGILSAAEILCRYSKNENLTKIAPIAIEWLSDDEVRVRIQSGKKN